MTYNDLFFIGTTVGNIYDNNSFHNVSFASDGVIFGSNTFHDVSFGGNATIYGNPMFGPNTFNDVNLAKNGTFWSSNLFNNLIFSPGYTYTLQASQTQTVGNICAQGTATLPIRIQSNTAGVPATISKTSGTICWDYVHVSDINATGGATFNAGLAPTNSQDLGGNTGLLFTGGCIFVSCIPCIPPSITMNPTPMTICEGLTVPFSIIANGTNLTYQWQVNQGAGFIDLTNTPPYNSVTSNILSISLVTTALNGYQYRCVVSDNCAHIITSGAATLTVNPSIIVTVNSASICAGQAATLTASGALHYTWSIIDTTFIPPPPSLSPAPVTGTGILLVGDTTNSITVSPASTTTYIVNGTANGCFSTANAIVTVNPAPSVTVNSVTINSGQTATLTASGAATYNWSTGETTSSISVSPASTATYSVTGTTNGCSDIAISTITVYQKPSDPITPDGLFDNVFDKDGHIYPLKSLIAGGNGSNSTASVLVCSSGYFRVYADAGSGIENPNDAIEVARKNVICQVLSDIAAFIPAPNGTPLSNFAGTTHVNLWVRNINDLYIPPVAVLGTASAFYAIPSLSNVPIPGGIAENEVYKTIVSGFDSYTNVAAPLIIANNPPGVAAFYHGEMAFNFNSYNLETNLGVLSSTHDLYSIALHEITHALGIASLIDYTGISKFGAGFPYFTSFDKFLTDQSGTKLIVPNSLSCSIYDYDYIFNPAINAGTGILHPGCNLNPNSGTPANQTACASALYYTGSVTLPVYTPSCFEEGSSLDHFEDECYINPNGINYGNDNYFTMSNAQSPGFPNKRYLKPEERKVLCDLGYKVGSTYGGTSVLNSSYNYGTGVCPGKDVIGINDGLIGSAYQFISTVGSGSFTFTGILYNDVDLGTGGIPASFECLEVISGGGSILPTSGIPTTPIYYSPSSTPGIILLRYVPVSHSGQRGNITYVYIYNNSSFSCTPDACNLVPNGDFEQHPGGIPNSTGQISYTCGWNNATGGSCDYFHALSPSSFWSVQVPCNRDGVENDKFAPSHKAYAGFFTQGIDTYTNEVVYTKLSSPLASNTMYQLTLDASLAEGISANGFPLGVCFAQNYLPNSGAFITSSSSNMFVPAPPPITNYNGWAPITINFTTGNTFGVDYGQDFIIIGNIHPGSPQNGTLIPLTAAPTGNSSCYLYPTAGASAGAGSYIYIDNVVLQPASLAATFTPPANVCLNQTLDLSSFVSIGGGTFSGNGVVGNTFNATTAGVGAQTITYTYTNNLQCVMHASAVITVVNTSIALAVIPPAPSICAGQSILLTASGAANYTWQPGSLTGTAVSVSPFSTTTYTVIATNASGCTTITVTVNQTPIVTATPTAQTICTGSSTSIALTNSLSGTTSWTVVQTGVTGATGGSGTTIAQTLTATGTVPGTAVYTVTPLANGCAGVPINITITVNPGPVATAFPTSPIICSGNTTAIALFGNATGLAYSWTVVQTGVSGAVDGSGFGITQTLNTTGSVPGTVAYTIKPFANGCPGTSASVTVTVNPTPTINPLNPIPTICPGDQMNLASYLIPAGGTFSGAGITNPTTLGTFSSSIIGTHTVHYALNGCPVTINVVVSGNCCTSTNPLCVIHSAGANSTSIGTSFTGSSSLPIAINGNFTINNTFTISSRTVEFAPNVKIIVMAGAKLIIDNSTLYSCSNMMWQGIEIEPGGKLVLTGSKIEDAQIAVYIDNTGVTTATVAQNFIIEKTIFNRNYIGVKVFNYTLGTLHPGYIRNCIFDSQVSTIPGNGTVATLDAPHNNQTAEIGVELDNVNAIQIGDASAISYKNQFLYLRTGIRAQKSVYYVYNNEFKNNFHTPTFCVNCPTTGWAIWNTDNIACIIGGYSSNQQSNNFQNLSNGILDQKGEFLFVQKNTFTNITDNNLGVNSVAINTYGFGTNSTFNDIQISDNTFQTLETGLSHRNNKNTAYNIYANTFKDFSAHCIDAVQNINGFINITKGGPNNLPNTFTQSPSNAYPHDIAINVANAVLPLSTSNVAIKNNIITRASNGIFLTNINAPQVFSNQVTFKSAIGIKYGIRSMRCYNEKINLNTISKGYPVPSSAYENMVYGISVESNQGLANVSENTTIRLGTGLRFRSYNTANSSLKCNIMTNNWAGLTLDASNIGQQGEPVSGGYHLGIAGDNQWSAIPNNMYGSVSVRGKNNPTQVPFYTRANGYPWCPTLVNVSPSLTIITSLTIPSLSVHNAPITCTNICYNPPCPRHLVLAQIARNQTPFNTVTGTARFTMQEAVVRSVLSDSIPPDITTTDGQDLQAFIDTTLTTTNVGKLITVSNKYALGDITGAIALNNSIVPLGCAEEYHQTVNSIFLNTWGVGNFYFSSADSTTLYNIAIQDPLLCGTAIYDARVMLGIDINDFSIESRMMEIPDGEGVITDKVGILYPNPAQNKCTYEATLAETESGMITMYDLTGKLLSSFKLNSGDNKIDIDLSSLSNGIYLYKIYINGEVADYKKLVIAK